MEETSWSAICKRRELRQVAEILLGDPWPVLYPQYPSKLQYLAPNNKRGLQHQEGGDEAGVRRGWGRGRRCTSIVGSVLLMGDGSDAQEKATSSTQVFLNVYVLLYNNNDNKRFKKLNKMLDTLKNGHRIDRCKWVKRNKREKEANK